MTFTAQMIERRQMVEDRVVQLFVATDRRDWPAVAECFADTFILDMTSMVGGTPQTLTPAGITAMWAAGFQNLDHVHHQVGNFQTVLVDDTATVRCHGVAFHHRAGIAASLKTRIFVGDYEIQLRLAERAWRITLLRFNLKFIDGNRELETAE